MLALVASGQVYTTLDLRIAGWVQGLNLLGLDFVVGLVNFVTDAPMAIALWLAAMTFLVLKGRPVEAIAIFLIMGLWFTNQLTSVIVPVVMGAVVEVAGIEASFYVVGVAALMMIVLSGMWARRVGAFD